MIGSYISRKLLEKEKYYQLGEYFLSLEEARLDLYSLILQGKKRIVLLGDAGYGKSTELKMITSRFIEEENPNFIPVYIELNTYSNEDMMEDYVRLKIGEESENLLSYDKSKLVFLFDEFDQVINKGIAERKIKNFIEKYNESTFVIACRTNFYSGQFKDCNIFVLLPLKSNDIKEYSENLLGSGSYNFLRLLNQYSIYDLAKNPFFLKYLVEIYLTDKRIHKKRTDIFSRIVSLSLEKDETRLKEKYDLRQTYPLSEIDEDLMYMSLTMESLQRNFISIAEFNHIISDLRKRQVISELSLIKKSFFRDGDVYQFQHNNFQEYLAAKMVKEANLKIILNFISFFVERNLSWMEKIIALLKYIEYKPFSIEIKKIISDLLNWAKYKRINKVNPSWVNTVAFLSQLRGRDDLLNYLIKNETELSLKFEVSKVDERVREKIFKAIFEKYTKRKIWLNRDRVDYEEMANFGKNKKIYEYLMKFARSKEHFTYRYNAIQMLGRMKELADESLYNLLVQYAKDKSENANVRHICLYALAWLGKADSETIESLKELITSNDETVLSGFYYLIKESEFVDTYVDILLSGIQRAKRSNLLDLSWNLRQAIEKVKSVPCIKKIIKHFINDPEELEEFPMERSLDTIVNNIIKAYDSDSSIYNDVKELTKILDKKYTEKFILKIRKFFDYTRLTLKFFKEIYEEGMENNYSLLAFIADEQSIDLLIDEYFKGEISEKNIQIFLYFLSWKNRNDYNRYLSIINQKTGKFLPPPPKDYEKERKEKLQREIQIIFDRRELLKEVEKIFSGDFKEKFTYEALESILFKGWHEDKYNDFVIRELMPSLEQDKSKEWTLNSLKEEINRWDYEWFTSWNIFDLLYHGTDLDLSEEQKTFIKNFCLKNLKKVDFRNVLEPEGKGARTSGPAIMLWFFLRKFALDYPKETLLDMLSFDWIEGHEFVGIDYLINRLPPEEVKKRILENLKGVILIDQVLKNHINYCKGYQVQEAKEILCEILENRKVEIETRLLALETIVKFGDSIDYLEKLLKTDELRLFIEVAKILILRDSKKLRKQLMKNLNSEKEEFALESAKLLIQEQNIKAIKFYVNHIKRTKEFEVSLDDKSPLHSIRTIKALPILIDLLKFSYKHRKDIKQDEFDRLDIVIINVLKIIALQNFSNFNKVSKGLQRFIKKQGSKLKSINFLNITCDDLERAFFATYSSQLSIDDAKRKIEKFLKK